MPTTRTTMLSAGCISSGQSGQLKLVVDLPADDEGLTVSL
jgi:hypothetical protein